MESKNHGANEQVLMALNKINDLNEHSNHDVESFLVSDSISNTLKN